MKPEDGYRYSLIAGAYTYRIQRNDSQEETGSFGVGSQDRDIPIYLPQQNANAQSAERTEIHIRNGMNMIWS